MEDDVPLPAGQDAALVAGQENRDPTEQGSLRKMFAEGVAEIDTLGRCGIGTRQAAAALPAPAIISGRAGRPAGRRTCSTRWSRGALLKRRSESSSSGCARCRAGPGGLLQCWPPPPPPPARPRRELSRASPTQVALQRKMLAEYEKREKRRKVQELMEVCPDITEAEAERALELCDNRCRCACSPCARPGSRCPSRLTATAAARAQGG